MYDPDAPYDDDQYNDAYIPPPAGQRSTAPPARRSYAWWSDPDTDPPAWMLNPSHPPVQATPGQYWNWSGDHWEMLPAPQANNQPRPPVGDTPPPDQTYGGGGGSGSGWGARNPNEGFQWPQYNAPRFGYGDFKGFNAFKPPSMDEILADPVLQAQLTEGRRGIKQDRAFRGILNTGDTLKDIFDWSSNRVKLGANDAFDRAFKVYDVNERQNPFNTWTANKGLALDTFNANAPQFKDEFMLNQYEPAKRRWDQNYNQWAKTGDWLATDNT